MPASARASCRRTSRCKPKTTNETTGGNPFNEKVVIAKKGDTLGSILHDLGASQDDIDAIAKVLNRGRDGGIKEGQKLRVLLSPVPGTKQVQPVRVIIAGDSSIDAVVALSDMGKYVPVDVRNVDTEVADNNAAAARGRRRHRHPPLSEHLRDGAAQPDPEAGDRRPRAHLFVRRRFPAQSAAGRLVRGALCRRGRAAGGRQPQRGAVRLAHGRRRGQEVLPLPVARRRPRRLL